MKNILSVVLLLVGIAVGYVAAFFFPFQHKEAPLGKPELDGKIVLFKKYTGGAQLDTGVSVPYDVTGTYVGAASLRLSPDKTKVVYSVWEDARVVLYVSGVDGSDVKRLAEQSVPEGSGGLNVDLIRWSDDSAHVLYGEEGLRCPKAECANLDEFAMARTNYSVDVQTGEKRVVPQN